MRTRTLLLLALLLASSLAGIAPVGGSAPDRPPVAFAGDDQTAQESQVGCSSTGSGAVPCHTVTINAQQGVRTYDPDASNTLAYSFRPTPLQCNPSPTTGPPGGGVPCIPIGDGSKFIDVTKYPTASTPTPAPPTNGAITSQTQGCPYVSIKAIGDGYFYFDTPAIPPGQASTCVYSIDMLVWDGTPHPSQPATGTAGVTDYTMDIDTIVVTIVPAAQPPDISKAKAILSLCTLPINDPNTVCRGNTSADVVDDHGRYIKIEYNGIKDDRETRSVQVLFNMTGGVPHAILVSLTTKTITTAYQSTPHVDETANFAGQLAVDTPALIVGSYNLNVRVYDGDGGVSIPPDNEPIADFTVTSSLGADSVPSYPCEPSPGATAVPGQGNAPCISFPNIAPASFTPNACFPGATSVPAQALGQGETMRPQVTWAYTDPNLNSANIAHIYDHSLLGWKFTYQSCVLNGGSTAYGPEVELAVPYFMSLDTLFSGNQEVMLRAYDRIGNPISTVVIPIVEDTQKPFFMMQNPQVTYKGIPFQMVVLVHDRISTAVGFHMDTFNRTSDGKAVHYDAALIADAGPYTPAGSETTLPRLSTMTPFDIFGKQDNKSACDYLWDSDGDAVLDSWYNPANHTMGRLLADADISGTFNNFVVDGNHNNAADSGEMLIHGQASGGIVDSGKCLDPFAGSPDLEFFLNDQPTQVFSFNVTRFLLGNTTYSFTIQDLVFNRFADASYNFTYVVGGTTFTSQTSYLKGILETRLAEVDAKVVKMGLLPLAGASGPYISGDKVRLYVNATQVPKLNRPVPLSQQPVVPLTLFLADEGTPECRTTADFSHCLTICPSSSNTGCSGVLTGPGKFLNRSFDRPIPQVSSEFIDPYNIVPGYFPPDLVAIAAQPYRPGIHHVKGMVSTSKFVVDVNPINNNDTLTFEIYLGQVVVGAYPAKAAPSGKVFYIRSDIRNLPQLVGGAVEVNATGGIVATHNLVLNQTGLPRYEFTYLDDKGAKQTAYWEPQTRYSRTYGKDCSQLTDTERTTASATSSSSTSGSGGSPPVSANDPQCRPITVITPGGTPVTSAPKGSPGPEVALIVVAIALLALLRRRR